MAEAPLVVIAGLWREVTSTMADLVSAVEAVLSRLSAIEAHLGIAAPQGGGGGAPKKVVKEDPRSIKAYDQYLR